MLELISSAAGLGLMLSLFFIGPVFFLLIETSLSRGARQALVLDAGVIFADVLCISASYFASGDLVKIIRQCSGFYRITAFVILIYGVYMMVSKTKIHLNNEKKIINQNYWKTFLNGFLLNILNIGVVLFWLVTTISARNHYPDRFHFIVYISIMIGTYIFVDLVKIILARQFHNKLTPQIANKIRSGVGVILIIFSVAIFLKSFKKFNRFDKELERSGYVKKSSNTE